MKKENLRRIMCMAWQMVKLNGYSMSEALKTSWRNYNLKKAMSNRIVKFYFQKVDGSIREAYGTLKSELLPATGSGRKANKTTQVYYDTEKQSWRCYKVANLIRIA